MSEQPDLNRLRAQIEAAAAAAATTADVLAEAQAEAELARDRLRLLKKAFDDAVERFRASIDSDWRWAELHIHLVPKP